MMRLSLSSSMIKRVKDLYTEMEAAYDDVAKGLQFSCQGCPDNCCDSYFLHHTYVEWSYLWLGVARLPEKKQKELIKRAEHYMIESESAISKNERPQIMCPLNEEGLCLVYEHRLMVCRTHGVPATLTRPDGKKLTFPGCFRCQERLPGGDDIQYVERTPMLRVLAFMENEYLQNKRRQYPKVKLTIAEMLIKGPPQLPEPFCHK